MPHVCSLRLAKFAESMAGLGHEVVLLVESYPNNKMSPHPASIEKEIASHDWSQPYLLPCKPIGFASAKRAREGKGNPKK